MCKVDVFIQRNCHKSWAWPQKSHRRRVLDSALLHFPTTTKDWLHHVYYVQSFCVYIRLLALICFQLLYSSSYIILLLYMCTCISCTWFLVVNRRELDVFLLKLSMCQDMLSQEDDDRRRTLISNPMDRVSKRIVVWIVEPAATEHCIFCSTSLLK